MASAQFDSVATAVLDEDEAAARAEALAAAEALNRGEAPASTAAPRPTEDDETLQAGEGCAGTEPPPG
jgi:hypothetical protein